MDIRYFRNENRLFGCTDYDWNLDALRERSNHTGQQLASTISDFCTAVSQCSIITNHEGRLTTLETNFADLYSDFYGAGGYLDNRLTNIVNNFTGVSAQYVIDSHSGTSLTKNARVSALTWEEVENNNTTIATLGWVKKEVSLMEPEGVAWLDPESKGLAKNTFSGVHDFTATDASLLYKTVSLETPSWEVASTMFVNQSLAKLNNLPIVTIGQPQSSSWNKIIWTLGSVSVNGTDYIINANLSPYVVGNTSGIYYLYYNPTSPNVTYQLSITRTPVNEDEGLVAKITLLSGTTGIVWQPSLDLTKLARLISPNLFTATNTFTKAVTLGTLDDATTRATGIYPLDAALDDNTLITAAWAKDRIDEAKNAYWSLVNSPHTTPHQLRAKEGVIVDLRSGDGRIVGAWATTPTEESPLQAIATKQYVLDMFEATMGIPIVTLVNQDPSQIEWTAGVVDLPTALAEQLDKTECVVPASTASMTISTSAKYIYVDYTTCAVVYSCDEVDELTQGKIIAVVNLLDDGSVTVDPTPDGGWAPIVSPLFRGDPRVPTPDPNDCDTSIPNTQWVCDKLFNLIHGPCGNAFPRVYQINTIDGLQLAIGVTAGGISHPSRRTITIAPTVDPIGCVATQTEYCWIRYKDDPPYYDIVVSASQPSNVEGILIAKLEKNGNVINIEHADTVATETTLSANYRAAWGGKIVYIGPVDC